VTNSTDGKALLKVQGLYTDEWRMWAAIGCVPSSSHGGCLASAASTRPHSAGSPRKARLRNSAIRSQNSA
jgi:hypothetical protein